MPYIHDGPPLYLAEDQQTVVEADSPRASYLLIATGGTLPDDVARRYGLPRLAASVEAETDGIPVGEQIDGQGLEPAQIITDADDPAEGEKAAPTKPNKARTPRENKAG